jgi:tetratricopeptide (TPR) repeat protein
MAEFPAASRPPAQLCMDQVLSCEVYVGVLGTQYGSPVRDNRKVSYTELEFDTATKAGKDRLVFLLDTSAANVGIPLENLIDRKYGARQDKFRRRVQDSELTTKSFTSPDMLARQVQQSLEELAKTRRRIGSGLEREQLPAQPQPVRESKFVNPPPAVAPTWFQDRQVETGVLAKYVTDPAIAMVCVTGRGGIGKTAMVCRLLKGLEAGCIPDVEGRDAPITVGGIVYLSRNGVHKVDYPTLVADLQRLVPADAAQRLQLMYQDPHRTPREMMLAVLEAFPAGEPVVVLLDNLESVMDAEEESLAEPALGEALTAVLTAPAHAVTIIATTRVAPAALLAVEPARQRQQRLDKGLDSPDAENVLRELDDDGHLGLRDADDALLGGLRQHTRGFPRALEAVKAILDSDPGLNPRDLLDRTRDLTEDQVVRVLVGEAYQLLDGPGKQVMQALAVFPAPVPAVAVEFLLRPVHPTIDATQVLTRLVRRQLVRFRDDLYYLHPADRDYARSQIPAGSLGDAPAAFTLHGLQAHAADYNARIRTASQSWHTLDDLAPQLAEFELRCATGDYNTAATVLVGIDFGYLQVWGHYRTLIGLHKRIHGHITDPALNAGHLLSLGNCHYCLGDYRQAIDMYTQALAIFRDTSDRQGEGNALGGLGLCHARRGDYQRAIDLHSQALAIFRDTGDRKGEGNVLSNLGNCHIRLGDYRQAIDLLTQALTIARDTGNRYMESVALGNLGTCHESLADYRQAIDLFTQVLAIAHATGNRNFEGAALGYLGVCHADLGDYRQAIDLHTQALTIARDTGDRSNEANALNYLGRARLASGDPREAVTLLEQAVSIADTIGDIESAAQARSGLARAQLQLGDPAAALAAAAAARDLPYPAERPTVQMLAAVALLQLHRANESAQAFPDALTGADTLLALADNNVVALQVRALALSGLAAVTSEPPPATDAAEAFARLQAVTSAAGVAADTRRIFETIATYDKTGVLAEIRSVQGP